MLAEFLDRLAEIVREGHEPKVLEPEGSASRRRILWNPNDGGTHTEFLTKPPKRGHKVHTLASLVEAVKTFGQSGSTVLWVNPGQVVASLNELSDDRDGSRITWDFPLHPAFAAIYACDRDHKKDHATFLRWLRTDIGDAIIEPTDLLQRLRVVKFDTLSSTSSESAKDLAKMGREVASMVQGIDSLPDSFGLTFDPFPTLVREIGGEEDGGIGTVTVEMTCQPKVEEAAFLVRQVAGGALMATAEAQEALRDVIQDRLKGFDVFSGTPE